MNGPYVTRSSSQAALPGPTAPRHLSVVVVTHNSQTTLPALLDSIPAACGELPHEVWVVDSASTDESVTRARAHPTSPHLLELHENLGYGFALNAGAAASRGTHLALANADLELAPGCLARLVDAVDTDRTVSAAGPLLRTRDGRPARSAWGFCRLAPLVASALGLDGRLGFDPALHWGREPAVWPEPGGACDVIAGALMVCRREVWERVGPFDEGYFLFWEDDDWCRRGASLGLRACYCPEAVATHLGGASTALRQDLDILYLESLHRYVRKHHGRAAAVMLWSCQLAMALLRAGKSVLASPGPPGQRGTEAGRQRLDWLLGRARVAAPR